jgi:hypothetical protein
MSSIKKEVVFKMDYLKDNPAVADSDISFEKLYEVYEYLSKHESKGKKLDKVLLQKMFIQADCFERQEKLLAVIKNDHRMIMAVLQKMVNTQSINFEQLLFVNNRVPDDMTSMKVAISAKLMERAKSCRNWLVLADVFHPKSKIQRAADEKAMSLLSTFNDYWYLFNIRVSHPRKFGDSYEKLYELASNYSNWQVLYESLPDGDHRRSDILKRMVEDPEQRTLNDWLDVYKKASVIKDMEIVTLALSGIIMSQGTFEEWLFVCCQFGHYGEDKISVRMFEAALKKAKSFIHFYKVFSLVRSHQRSKVRTAAYEGMIRTAVIPSDWALVYENAESGSAEETLALNRILCD